MNILELNEKMREMAKQKSFTPETFCETVQDCTNILLNAINPLPPALRSHMIFALNSLSKALSDQDPKAAMMAEMYGLVLGSTTISGPIPRKDKQ